MPPLLQPACASREYVFDTCEYVRRMRMVVRRTRKRVCSHLLADLLAGACEPRAGATIETHHREEVTHALPIT